MRVNVDSKALGDPRIKRLAAALSCSWQEALGRSIQVWMCCYERRSELISAVDVDIVADTSGFADAMVSAELADKKAKTLRIRGVSKRIQFLTNQSERGRRGGKAKAIAVPQANARANATGTALAYSPALSPSPDHVLAQTPAHALALEDPEKNSATLSAGGLPRSKRKTKPSEPTDLERSSAMLVLDKLGKRNGISYTGAAEHVRLIVAQLRTGRSELDLRKVVAYCSEHLEWQGDPDMEKYLRPETLFGTKTIAKYLDAALTWFEKSEHSRAPRLEAVS